MIPALGSEIRHRWRLIFKTNVVSTLNFMLLLVILQMYCLEEFIKKFSQMEDEIVRLKKVNLEIETQVLKLRQEVHFMYTFLQEHPQAHQSLVKRLSMSTDKCIQSATSTSSISTTDGTITWKISSYFDCEKRAQRGLQQSLSSEPFYSFKEGYKFRVDIYPHGRGSGRGTHLSFCIVWLKGEYDYRLSWPFLGQVSIVLMDKLHQPLETNIPIMVECLHRDSQYYYVDRALTLESVHNTESYMLDDCVCLSITVKPFELKSQNYVTQQS